MLIAVALAAVAQPAPAAFSPEVVQAAADWGICRETVVRELIGSGRTAEQIADAAVERCTRHLNRLSAAVAGEGASARRRAAPLIAEERAQIVRAVEGERNGTVERSPQFLWGQCLGRARGPVLAAPDREAAIDRAFAACRDEEEAVLQAVTAERSAQEAAVQVETLRGIARERLFVPGGVEAAEPR